MTATLEEYPGSRATSIILVNTLLPALSTIALLARLLTRALYLNDFGLDDLFCTIGWAFTVGLCVVCAYMVNFGYGTHIETITTSNLSELMKWDFASEILYVFAFVTIKMSFLFFYQRIFPRRGMRWSCYILNGILVCQCIEEVLVVIFQCHPVDKVWNSDAPGECLSLLGFFYVSFGIKLGVDIAIFLLPIPDLWRLNLPSGKKFGVMVMFLLGLLICITSIIRATYLTNTSTDISWILVDELNWSSVEVCVAIICACIPSFKALISIKFPSINKMLGLSSSHETSALRENRTYGRTFSTTHSQHIRLQNMGTGAFTNRVEVGSDSRGDSEECIVKPEHGIKVTTDYTVSEARAT